MKRTVSEIASSPDRSELIDVDKLSFDSRNPRLIESGEPTNQKDILQILWREFSVAEIALSIAANGEIKGVGSTLVQNKFLKCLRLVSKMGCSSTPIDGVATPCHPQAGGIIW